MFGWDWIIANQDLVPGAGFCVFIGEIPGFLTIGELSYYD